MIGSSTSSGSRPRARETRSAAHELAQVFFHARASARAPDSGTVQVLSSLEEIASATAEAVVSGTRQVRQLRTMSPRTREVLDAPLHAHAEPTLGPDGRPLAFSALYDPGVLEIDNMLAILRARERGGERRCVRNERCVVDDSV